jgi:L-threonylcarbamoyladenylate synthase
VVRAGGVLLYPTDTLYGLGADPCSPAAVARVFRLKGRSADKPLPVLIEGPHLLERFAASVPEAWQRFIRRFWPGPLTLVFPARGDLPPGVRSAAGEVAVRVPGSALCRAVLRAAGGSLTGTSANPAGGAAPADPLGAAGLLYGLPDLVLDAGTLPPSPVSTIIRMGRDGRAEVVREGAVGRGELEAAEAGEGAVDNAGIRVL